MTRSAGTAGRTEAPPPDGAGAGPSPAPGVLPARRDLALRGALLALLAAAVVAAFSPVLRAGWILFDDPEYVFAQPHVLHGLRLSDALWFLSHAQSANWHPLTSWSHMLDVQLLGVHPGAHHAVSLGLHALNAVLLALALFRLTGSWWRSLAVAALFALHPLRVESVAWISERKDVLSGLFFMLTLLAYAWWTERPGRLRYTALVVALALGLLAKPMLVTLPFVLVLLDVWPLRRLRTAGLSKPERARAHALPALLAEKWPLFALAAASAVVTYLVQHGVGAMITAQFITPGRRLANAVLSIWIYAGATAWPRRLAIFYPYAPVTNWLGAALGAAALAAATWACVAQWRARPYLAVGWLWFLGMLVPVIGLVQVGSQAHADRYTYLPTIGLLVAVVWLVGDLVARSRALRIAAAVALLLALAGFSVATARQAALWKDTRTLFSAALRVDKDNPVAHQCLGSAYLQDGKVGPAIAELSEAIRLSPLYPDAHANLGSALGMVGRNEEAAEHFRAALRMSDKADIHHNLAATLDKLGRVAEAIPEYKAALAREPDRVLTLVMLGKDLAARGRLAEAEPLLARAVRLDPAQIEPRRLLAVALTVEGRVEDAIRQYQEILRRSPDDLDALNNVAWIRATHADAAHRNGAEAVRLAERARVKSPEPQALVYSTLAAAYAETGRFADAVRTCEQAIALAERDHAAQDLDHFREQLRCYRASRPFHFAP